MCYNVVCTIDAAPEGACCKMRRPVIPNQCAHWCGNPSFLCRGYGLPRPVCVPGLAIPAHFATRPETDAPDEYVSEAGSKSEPTFRSAWGERERGGYDPLAKIERSGSIRAIGEAPEKGKSEQDFPFPGAGGPTRTGTRLPARDFKSLVSTIPPHRLMAQKQHGHCTTRMGPVSRGQANAAAGACKRRRGGRARRTGRVAGPQRLPWKKPRSSAAQGSARTPP